MPSKPRPFVKSADTETKPERSRAEVEKMLRRYGAVGISIAQQFDDQQRVKLIVVEFMVPNSGAKDAAKVPVRLPVDVHRVYDALYGRPQRWTQQPDHAWGYVHNPKGYDGRKMEQAERVAWRNLVLWLDAALSAAVIGLQTITEAFLAHTLVVDDSGGTRRMMDYLDLTQGALAPGVRALLAAPAQEG